LVSAGEQRYRIGDAKGTDAAADNFDRQLEAGNEAK
jgi:hypothetical protein